MHLGYNFAMITQEKPLAKKIDPSLMGSPPRGQGPFKIDLGPRGREVVSRFGPDGVGIPLNKLLGRIIEDFGGRPIEEQRRILVELVRGGDA